MPFLCCAEPRSKLGLHPSVLIPQKSAPRLCCKSDFFYCPRSGRMKIAQRFSAGDAFHLITKSVKRTIEKVSFSEVSNQPSASRTQCVAARRIPPMNRWAIVIRRLRRLLPQIRAEEQLRSCFVEKLLLRAPSHRLSLSIVWRNPNTQSNTRWTPDWGT